MTDPLLLLATTVAALLAGLLLGWVLGARPAVAARTAREQAQLELAALKAAQGERDAAHAAELARLEAHFQALAARALDDAQRRLTERADLLLKGHQEAAGRGQESSRAQLAELLQPMRDMLERYEKQLQVVEQARQESYGRLDEAVRGVVQGQEKVSGATARLETALRSSGAVAGRWGEEQCRNVLEAAGLVEGIDFTAQESVTGEEGRQRPDFVITLPGGRRLVVDVKCSLAAFVSAADADTPEARQQLLEAHARAVRTHADGLARKDYVRGFADQGAVDFVVLFVPGENFLAAAVQHDRALLQDFFRRGVVLAGPVNLVAVARTVAALRDQARLAEEAERIATLGRELYDALRIMGGNFAAVQQALDGAVRKWNALVSQAETRVLARARRFPALGVQVGGEIPEAGGVEQQPQRPGRGEWSGVVGDG